MVITMMKPIIGNLMTDPNLKYYTATCNVLEALRKLQQHHADEIKKIKQKNQENRRNPNMMKDITKEIAKEARKINKEEGNILTLASMAVELNMVTDSMEDTWKRIKFQSKEDSLDGDAMKAYLQKKGYVMSRLYYIKRVFNIIKACHNRSEKALSDLADEVTDLAYIDRCLKSIEMDGEFRDSFKELISKYL